MRPYEISNSYIGIGLSNHHVKDMQFRAFNPYHFEFYNFAKASLHKWVLSFKLNLFRISNLMFRICQ